MRFLPKPGSARSALASGVQPFALYSADCQSYEQRTPYAGIRPLYDDGASKAQEATREYVLKLEAPEGQPPLLSVFGAAVGFVLAAGGAGPIGAGPIGG